MSQENYQNIPTTIVSSQTKYLPTVYLPTQEFQTYSTPTVYNYTNGQYYQQAQATQTKIKTTTTKTTVTNYNPHTIYYSNGQYIKTANNNKIIYSPNTYTQGQTIITTQTRNTAPGYEYQQIKEKMPHIQKVASEESEQNINNMTYPQRKTNYPKTNNLNLNQIYNMSNTTMQKTNKVNDANKIKNINANNATYDYNYYNNNMFMVDSSNISNQKQKNQITQKNVDPNQYYYNNYYNQQHHQAIKANKNTIPKKANVNVNYVNNTNVPNTKTNTNINTNINSQAKTSTTNNQTNAYTNNKIIINNKKNTHHQVQNYTGYPSQQNTSNNIYDGYLQEPPDNMRNKKKNNVDPFNRTMPNLRNKEDITIGVGENTVSNNTTINRKSHPLQVISNFEISFNNTAPEKSKNTTTLNKNNITTNNINITDNSNKNINNVQNSKAQNIEYKDKHGNIYLLINGQYVLKKKVTQNTVNNTTNVNQNQILQNDKTKINPNVKNQKMNVTYKNKNDTYYENEKTTQNPTEVNTGICFDTYTGKVISNSNINQIQQEFNIENKNQYNNNFNNTYPLQGQKAYILDNAAYQNQNVILNQRDNRFIQDPNYVNINTNTNLNINNNFDYAQQQQQIINNITYKKTKSGMISENNNDILTVEPQKPKKRRPVYKIPPSKKRAISQGRSLAFIHKYYDENFIMEEDNENGSDNENKKKNRLKNIFREVTNIRKLIPKWQEMKEKPIQNNLSLEQNQNDITKNEKINKGNIADYLENANNNNNEQKIQNMRLSHMRFSLEGSTMVPDDSNKDNNNIENNINIESNKKENGQNNTNKKIKLNKDNNIENEESKNTSNLENNQNNIELRNSEIKTASGTITPSNSKDISVNIEKENVSNSNLSGPRNSDSLLENKSSLGNNNNTKINLENKNSQESHKSLNSADVNNSSKSSNNQQGGVNETIMSSLMPNFMEPRENMQDSMLNSNINMNVEKTQIINNDSKIENDKKENKENDEEVRQSINIAAHDLDKYFEKEGVNKRDQKQEEVSYSLKTINLENETATSQIIGDNVEGEEPKKAVGNSTNSSNLSGGNSKDGSQLPTIDDAITGSVHLPEKIQKFVSKNNDLYNDYNK